MASDYLLEIDGIKGESQDSKHKDTIEIASFSWGAKNTGAHAGGGGGGTGKVSFQDIHFTTSVNKSTPLLFLACATGQHIKKATLFVRKQGGDQHDYYKVTMEDLLVSGVANGHEVDDTDAIPYDAFSLNFAKVKLEYFEQKPDGKVGGAVVFGYDLKANTKL